MSRAITLSALVVVATLARGAEVPGLAKASPDPKELAKAKFERGRANLAELVKARRDLARQVYEVREKEFLAGRGTLDFLNQDLLRLQEAELALHNTGVERVRALERHWQRAWLNEQSNRERYDYGRIPTKDYLETRYLLRKAEIWLAEVRTRDNKLLPLQGGNWIQNDPLSTKHLARAKLAASLADPRALVEAKLEDARGIWESRYKEFLAGRGTLDFLLKAFRRLLEAECDFSQQETNRLAALERHWIQTKITEDVNTNRFEYGRIPLHDLQETRHARLEAEIWLAQARSQRGKLSVPVRKGRGLLVVEFNGKSSAPVRKAQGPLVVEFNLDAKELASAMFEATQTDPDDLTTAKLEAIRGVFEARYKEFLNGRGTILFELDSSQRLLESELAVVDKPADRIAALERYWDRCQRIEEVNQKRYDQGRIPIQDYLESRYFRLDAAIRLAQARSKR